MASAVVDFPQWLNEKLQELNTDETVFGSYIKGILDSDETAEEKAEAIQGILSEFVANEDEIIKICNEILERWQNFKPEQPVCQQMSSEDVNIKLAKLLESQSLPTAKQREYTDDEKKIRNAILSQYSQTAIEENECEEGSQSDYDQMEKNVNAQTVANAEKIKREQSRIDSQKKKEKDKEDREKQKQLKEEKKEKRKTVKGERRR